MSKKKRAHEEEHENHERWLVTYADMITLLMVLFIVLFSMAAIDQKKFTQFKESLSSHKSSESVLEGTPTVIDGGQTDMLNEYPAESSQFEFPDLNVDMQVGAKQNQRAAQEVMKRQQNLQAMKDAEKNNFEQVKEEMQAELEARNMQDKVQFKIDRRGLVVTVISDKVLFATGSADIQQHGSEILDAIGHSLAHVPNDIKIEGHTDNVPISTPQFPSNWYLSAARAASVLTYLVDHKDVMPEHVEASGFGEMHPAASNDTAEGRSLNRRVEIVIKTAAQDG